MTGQRGSAMIWLVFIVLLLMLLGSSLLNVAQSDLRVSGHLLAAVQAQYAAEAGIEMALAVLGPACRGLGEEGWTYVHSEEPIFTVTAVPENEHTLRIRSVGYAGVLTETMEVVAKLRPLGGQALIAQRLRLNQIHISGHVTCDEVAFTQGDSTITGDLRTFWTEAIDGGSYQCGGHLCGEWQPYALELDFWAIEEQSTLNGWVEASLVDGVYRIETTPSGPVFASGSVDIALVEASDVLVVALGDVTLSHWVNGSRLVVIATGNVFMPAGEGSWEGSLFVYSGGRITRIGDEMLTLNGALAAPEMELAHVHVEYCDEALLSYIREIPQPLLTLGASFDLEWLELAPRR